MAILAGIDEAGYGPPLGPLVVSATAFRVPDAWRGRSLWETLADTVAESPADAGGRIVVADSKAVYKGKSRSLKWLELATLAFVQAARDGPPIRTLGHLLERVSLTPAVDFDRQPWYREREVALPLACDAASVDRQARYVRKELSARGARFLGARARIVVESRFNETLAAGANKADVVWRAAARLIRELWSRYPQVAITLDKQGGRAKYGRPLHLAFKGCVIRGFAEEPARSAYRLEQGPRAADLLFLEGGERQSLPVALASMVSKYLRELFMRLFNAFWQGHAPGVAPTAGYPEDARRFLSDIAPARARLAIPDDLLVRRK
ncbi:MAG: hypothetical protein HY719_10085 [Planctomycetes bacterium]|nr:hypothetical protein [Planctomycetota bacterium]